MLSSSIRPHFVPWMDKLMDENTLLGVHRVGMEVTRSLALSGMRVFSHVTVKDFFLQIFFADFSQIFFHIGCRVCDRCSDT